MPAFSPAISVKVSPRKDTWSIETGVIAVRAGLATTLVASSLPPNPVSSSKQIGRRLGEGEKGRRRGDLEQRDQLAVIGRFGAGEAIDQQVLGDRRRAVRPGEHDALMKMDEMRRGIDMHAFAERLGDGAGEGEERALAVGAGDMQHRGKLLLGMAERGKQALDPPERQVDRLRMQLFQPLQQRIARRDPGAGRSAPGAMR